MLSQLSYLLLAAKLHILAPLEDAVADPVNSPGAGPHLVVPQLVQHFNLSKPVVRYSY